MEWNEVLDRIDYVVGNADVAGSMNNTSALTPFDNSICQFLNDLSDFLIKSHESRKYPDVMTFAFWIRKASVIQLKEYFEIKQDKETKRYLGLGTLFHIAPSNVPVNFAYSLSAGLMLGNANIVRLPSKYFQQTEMICSAINAIIDKHPGIKPYICLVKYGHDKEINDILSDMCDARIIWGGDKTISEIRQSPLPPRSREISFADRFSLTIIDSDYYLGLEKKNHVVKDFYNDTYLTDQNACTSPKLIIWKGNRIKEAKNLFWKELHEKVIREYEFTAIQAVDKIDMVYQAATEIKGVQIVNGEDNLITRVEVPEISEVLLNYACHSGLFYEYECIDISDMLKICNNKKVQTLSYIDKKSNVEKILNLRPSGIDRIVPVGKTMDFSLIWDGYDLRYLLTRTISIE